ncbi:MAG: hypothetical protein Phyf2KO_07140 [Phycisphaerales bacterium]
MRLVTYVVQDPGGSVEVAVTRFDGRVGGELANINRWRGQMGLDSIGAEHLEGTIKRFSSPGFDGYETRIESASGVMLASGVYEQAQDRTWFVRATVATKDSADRIQSDLFRMARSISDHVPEESD